MCPLEELSVRSTMTTPRSYLLIICSILLLVPGCGAIARSRVYSNIEAINNGDMAGFLRDLDADATFEYPGGLPVSGKIEGREAIEKWFANWRETFPDIEFTIKNILLEKIFYLGRSNVVAIHWEAEITNKYGLKAKTSGVTVATIEGTKIAHVKDYIFDAHKLNKFWGIE